MYKVNDIWWSSEPAHGFFSQRLDNKIDTYYQQRYRYYVFNNIPRRRTMIDVGANIGIFARPSAEIFERVICFEPVSKNFAALEKNLAGYQNVELHAVGLSDTDKTVKFELQHDKCGHSMQVEAWRDDPAFERYECSLTTLDRFEFTEVDWIKIDVEGFEFDVMMGAQQTIKRNRPWLLIERNGQEHLHEQWLNDLCGPYRPAPVKSKTNTIWIPE